MIMIWILLVGMAGVLPGGRAYASGAVLYVQADAGGANAGTSWADAFTGLQSALLAADPGDQVWVAAGTYHPTEGTDPNATFRLESGVAIYGGFAGTETDITQRDPKINVTILSGDIGVQGSVTDNSIHVVTGSSTDDTAVLDGFTITAGYALPAFPSSWGAGMYIQQPCRHGAAAQRILNPTCISSRPVSNSGSPITPV